MRHLSFHGSVREWFERTFDGPTKVQEDGWAEIAAGRDTLIAAPTGSGKTLAAFLWALNELVEKGTREGLEDKIHVVYVSPLKALGNDIEKNLRRPLAEIAECAARSGVTIPEIRIGVRSGDTPPRERALQRKRPPHILITTPESLYILLTAEKSRAALREARTVIVDEIHAVAEDKRGSHLALSLERLDTVAVAPLQRIGLSATQNPIEEVARLLVGTGRCSQDGSPRCAIVDAGHKRELDLSIETMDDILGPITSQELRAQVYERIAELAAEHKTTIIFTNTRRMVERVAHALSELLGSDKVAAHHGSLSRETRLAAEEGLKNCSVPVVVATASLELGIDVGHIDLVVHLGSARSLATLLQRVGRSGHFLGAVPKGILFPMTRDDLLQSAASVRAVLQGKLDRLHIRTNCLDILAQQMVASVAAEELGVDALFARVTRAYPYKTLERSAFDQVLETLAEGISTKRGRKSAHLHYDRVGGHLRARRGARLAAITSGGAIPDTADFRVIEEPAETFVGTVNEDFAVESLTGDIFLLGNRSWRIKRVTNGQIRVIDAQGAPPTIPFWLGEAPARSEELSDAVTQLRRDIEAGLGDQDALQLRLQHECRVDAEGAVQLIDYVRDTVAVLGTVPARDTVIAERFFDEAGGMQLVLHAPFGGRVNRALGLALRKKFCRSFDFELQAAATDDGVVLSLGEQHSFPLANVFSMLNRSTYREDLAQASLASPMFTNRWRWNATRSLALLRHMGGRRVPMPIQRMRAEDLLGAVFPAQLGCQDNRAGDIELPDHPLVNETMRDCLEEAMDVDALGALIDGFADGSIRAIAVETAAPSPMSHEILNANPYAFLDDAPLEERRARAVSLRRTDPDLAGGLGRLDASAIEEVRRQAWPDARDRDEVHDALLSLVYIRSDRLEDWEPHVVVLVEERRAFFVRTLEQTFVAASEKAPEMRALFAGARFEPQPPRSAWQHRADETHDEQRALLTTVRGWMDALGPVTAAALAAHLGRTETSVQIALAGLENEGRVLQGNFTYGAADQLHQPPIEWCERSLLARIHRFTLGRLRAEIEPVSPVEFIRFLLRWQHLEPGTQLHGREGIRAVLEQLQGIELPGPGWERDVLPARIKDYDPADLEQLCLSGEIVWGRLSPAEAESKPGAPRRRHSAPTRSAPLAFFLRADMPLILVPPSEDQEGWRSRLSQTATEVLDTLESRGASFLNELAQTTGRLPSEIEDALWQLVSAGAVTGDGVAGLRTLLMPESKRKPGASASRRRAHLRAVTGGRTRRLMPVGRWSLLRAACSAQSADTERAEAAARRLLARYGVVFRDVCARERSLPPWRSILRSLRAMEARAEVRGGRFVAGFVGEQFALPEALETLRSLRRMPGHPTTLIVAAADPLNLEGILTPGPRVSPNSLQVLAISGGETIDVGELGEVRSRLRARQRGQTT